MQKSHAFWRKLGPISHCGETGASGFADKTAYDLALERGLLALSAELKPEP